MCGLGGFVGLEFTVSYVIICSIWLIYLIYIMEGRIMYPVFLIKSSFPQLCEGHCPLWAASRCTMWDVLLCRQRCWISPVACRVSLNTRDTSVDSVNAKASWDDQAYCCANKFIMDIWMSPCRHSCLYVCTDALMDQFFVVVYQHRHCKLSKRHKTK